MDAAAAGPIDGTLRTARRAVELRDGLVTYGHDYAFGINGTSMVWTSFATARLAIARVVVG